MSRRYTKRWSRASGSTKRRVDAMIRRQGRYSIRLAGRKPKGRAEF